jgi:REP element-mobilizing transposase RayT
MIRFDHYLQFITITNLNWLPVLENEHHKAILIEALQPRTLLEQVSIYAFVIMPNHFHAIWHLHDGINKSAFQRDLLKFTASRILKHMLKNKNPLIEQLRVNAADREYQVWERNSLSIDIHSRSLFQQKLEYIHHNPLQPKWNLASVPEEYYFSSASFYETGEDKFGFLKHYKD